MTDVTTDASSIGSSRRAEIAIQLIAEQRWATVLVALMDRIPAQKGNASFSWQQLTSFPTMQTVSLGTTEANAGTQQALVTASRTATIGLKTAWILQSWVASFTSTIDWKSEIPKILGRARADIMESDAGALHSTHTITAGTTATPLSLETLRVAQVQLDSNWKNGTMNALYALNPLQLGQVSKDLIGGAGVALNELNPTIARIYGDVPGSGPITAFKGLLLGTPVITTGNIGKMNADADYGGSLVIPGEAHGLVEAVDPNYPPLVTNSQAVNLSPADSWGAVAMYGMAKKNNNAACTVVSEVPT